MNTAQEFTSMRICDVYAERRMPVKLIDNDEIVEIEQLEDEYFLVRFRDGRQEVMVDNEGVNVV